MSDLDKPNPYGYGDGSGSGYGDGDGSGNGSGYGDGDGSGDGQILFKNLFSGVLVSDFFFNVVQPTNKGINNEHPTNRRT